ncbi:MAG: hypothetical protein JOY65_11175 [Acetobacteraceae bacterium]|jgi:hypothetical protein|nr:hypothetical protein [Acetobacteraceae bacterium]MBV9115987.1 hypothetical protein [Acetobacteraceae bacterium]
MRATIATLALALGLAVGGATLVPGGPAHAANTSWFTTNGGGAQGGGAG